MSLSINETTIKNILDGLLLKRIPQNKSVEKTSSNFKNNSYTLEWKPSNPEAHISNNYIYSNNFMIEISYIVMNDDERVAAGENFITIFDALRDNENFDGFEEWDFRKVDDQHYKGVLNFLFGLEVSV